MPKASLSGNGGVVTLYTPSLTGWLVPSLLPTGIEIDAKLLSGTGRAMTDSLTPVGRTAGTLTSVSVVPASGSEAFAKASIVTGAPSSLAEADTVPVTMGASFTGVTLKVIVPGTEKATPSLTE